MNQRMERLWHGRRGQVQWEDMKGRLGAQDVFSGELERPPRGRSSPDRQTAGGRTGWAAGQGRLTLSPKGRLEVPPVTPVSLRARLLQVGFLLSIPMAMILIPVTLGVLAELGNDPLLTMRDHLATLGRVEERDGGWAIVLEGPESDGDLGKVLLLEPERDGELRTELRIEAPNDPGPYLQHWLRACHILAETETELLGSVVQEMFLSEDSSGILFSEPYLADKERLIAGVGLFMFALGLDSGTYAAWIEEMDSQGTYGRGKRLRDIARTMEGWSPGEWTGRGDEGGVVVSVTTPDGIVVDVPMMKVEGQWNVLVHPFLFDSGE